MTPTETTQPTPRALPRLDADSIDRMERDVFAAIDEERSRRRRRTVRGWSIAAAAAAVVAVAAVAGPAVTATLVPTTTAGVAPDAGVVAVDGGESSMLESEAATGAADAVADDGARTAEIIATGSATVTVDDVADAAAAIGADAEARGGYVQSVSVSSPQEGTASGSSDGIIEPWPIVTADGWITVRVPADELTDALRALDDVGEVTATSVSRDDVTEQAIDVRARLAVAEASVDRLTELLAEAADLSDLIAAEAALAERQADADALRQQLDWLESQVSMSTLSVQLALPTDSAVDESPGFVDGVVAGWQGLIAALSGIVVGIGFLLPWVIALGVVALAVWAIVRVVRRRRGARPAASQDADDDPDAT